MTSLYMYYALSFVLVEHSVCHEPIFVLINVCVIYIIYVTYDLTKTIDRDFILFLFLIFILETNSRLGT